MLKHTDDNYFCMYIFHIYKAYLSRSQIHENLQVYQFLRKPI